MSTTRITRHIKAPRADVYRALVDVNAVVKWKVPDGMSCQVHEFDPRDGGRLRISLTYDSPSGIGKSGLHTDTYHGRFVKLVPGKEVVEIGEFETTDPGLRGEMTITILLRDSGEIVLLEADNDETRRRSHRGDGWWRILHGARQPALG